MLECSLLIQSKTESLGKFSNAIVDVTSLTKLHRSVRAKHRAIKIVCLFIKWLLLIPINYFNLS